MKRRTSGWYKAVAVPVAVGVVGVLALSGCAVVGHKQYAGEKYVDTQHYSDFDTPNLESQDIQTACQMAVSRMLASDLLNRVSRTPVFVVEDEHFAHKGQGDFDTRALVDLFRNELINAGAGRIRVVRPMGETMPLQPDFIVQGRVTDVWNTDLTAAEAYTQIAFNVTLAGSGEVLFSDLYSVKKGANIAPELY